MTAWMRHRPSPVFCAVAAVHFAASTVTRCGGRWPTTDNETELVEEKRDPSDEERCGACQAKLVEAGMIERGLREMSGVVQFDLSDVEGE